MYSFPENPKKNTRAVVVRLPMTARFQVWSSSQIRHSFPLQAATITSCPETLPVHMPRTSVSAPPDRMVISCQISAQAPASAFQVQSTSFRAVWVADRKK